MSEFGFRDSYSGLKKGFYTNNEKPELAKKILSNEGISIEGENVTPIDLFSIPEGLTSQEKLKIIANNLRMEEADLKKRLPDISRYWREAKDFYKKFLVITDDSKPAFPREIEKLDDFSSLQELEKHLDKATVLKKGEGLGLGPTYCALFSLMIAGREYETEEFEGLFKESNYLSEQLFKEDEAGIIRMHKVQEEDEDWNRVGIMTNEDAWMNAKFSFRGKTKDSMTAKMAKKPDSSAEERIRDGIGLKFEVADGEEARKLFLFIIKILQDNFGADRIIFENINLFNGSENELIQEELKKQGVVPVSPGKNASSHKNFKVAKIEGKLKIPKNGEPEKRIMTRNFEVQVVLTNNKNETGLAQNKIYKRIQKLSLYTRLFGSFNEKYLDLICQEASQVSGVAEKKIKDYIIDNFLLRVGTSTKNIKYISKDQFQRWKKVGMVPKEIEKNIQDKK